MPSRNPPLIVDAVYHIYNRGSEKRRIFDNTSDYQRFLKTLQYYQQEGFKPRFSHFNRFKTLQIDPSKKIVEILCFCLMPNHFHFLLKQLKTNGITEFVSKLSNSYTKYYNTKYNRVGPLLQGEFKAVLLEDDEQLLHLSRYIHLNPFVSFLVKDLNQFKWSSYQEYITNSAGICSKKGVLGFFKSSKDYQQFVLDQADYGKQLELIKHKLLEAN